MNDSVWLPGASEGVTMFGKYVGQYMLRNISMIEIGPWRVKNAWTSQRINLHVFASDLDFFSVISVRVNSNSRLIEG